MSRVPHPHSFIAKVDGHVIVCTLFSERTTTRTQIDMHCVRMDLQTGDKGGGGGRKQEQIGILGKHILMESLEMFSFIIRVLIFSFYFLDGFKLKCLGVIIQDVDVSKSWVNSW